MILGFKFFHPHKGEPPNTLSSYANDAIHRARKMLSDRSIKEIKGIADSINWMINHPKVRETIFNRFACEIEAYEDGKEASYQGDITTSFFGLRAYQDNFTDPETGISNLQWHEIYAVLALALIDKATDDEKYYSSWHNNDDWLHEWRIHSHASTWIVEAIEAITWADGLLAKQNTINDAKQKLSVRNSFAAIQRHAKTNEAILELAEIYQSGNFKSMRNAAQIYSEKHPDKVSHLAHYNRIRTLSDGLSKLLKNERRSLKPTSNTFQNVNNG